MANENLENLSQEACKNVHSYFALSNMLFGSNPPYNINELSEKNQFYQPAKALTKELEIDWEKMTHEESNRIMLSLLDDYFQKINVNSDFKYTLQIKVEE